MVSTGHEIPQATLQRDFDAQGSAYHSGEVAIGSPESQRTNKISHGAPAVGLIGGVFTQSQITVLLCQIYAFKLLSANAPIPPRLRQIILDSACVANNTAESTTQQQYQSPVLPRIVETVFRNAQRPIVPGSDLESLYQQPFYPGIEDLHQGRPHGPAPELDTNQSPAQKILGHQPSMNDIHHKNATHQQNVLDQPQLAKQSLNDRAKLSQSLDSQNPSQTKHEPHSISKPQLPNGPLSLFPKKVNSEILKSRVLIPSAAPPGIDPQALLYERERQLNARIEYRIKELENLPANITNDNSKKLKTLIELKSLKLVKKQWKLRSKILMFMKKFTTFSTAIDRNLYRRVKKRDIREARQTEKLESTRRMEHEKKETQRYQDFLLDVINNGRNILSFRKRVQGKAARMFQAVSRYHATVQKEEERRIQKTSQERLSALKANDEAAYLRLVDKEKDNRIIHLLNQTESYLGSLTKAVNDQKMEVIDDGEEYMPSMKTDIENDEDETRDYYSTAHRINEVVTQQSSILVGGKLKDYQLKGLQWMISLYNNKLNGILADEMGLGKTIQTISLITYLIEKKKQNGPYLVIVPLSTITNWDLEFERWAPSVSRIVFKGTAQERQKLKGVIKAGNFNVLITTYEFIIKEKALLGKFRWVYMIIDEGHRMKNAQSKLSTTLMHHYNSRYRLILTGTPLQNSLPELWAILNFILPKIFNSVETFDEWFNHPFSKEAGKESDIKLNEEESLLIIRGLHKVLRPFLLRRLKKDVESELPDKVETVVKCPMSALQLHLYEQIKVNKSVFGLDGITRRKALNNLVMQFRKVCNHPYVFEEVEQLINPFKTTDDNLWRVSGKFELLDRVLPKFKARNHRVLIFFQMTQVMDIMEDYLIYRGYTYLRLDGHTKTEDRTEMLKSFNREDNPPFIFLLSTRAGGLGLNLQTADTVVIFDSDWNPHQDLQAQDRAHRIGQTKEVRILRLVTSRSIEEAILARAQYKLDMDGKVIQAGKFDNKTTDRERDELLRSLFGTDEGVSDKDAHEEILDDVELNETIARSEEELEAYNEIDIKRDKELEERKRAGIEIPHKSRLFTEQELPRSFFRSNKSNDVESGTGVEFGRGARVRKVIKYDDGLNEDQFLESIEDGTFCGYFDGKESETPPKGERRKRKYNISCPPYDKQRTDSDGSFSEASRPNHDTDGTEDISRFQGGDVDSYRHDKYENSSYMRNIDTTNYRSERQVSSHSGKGLFSRSGNTDGGHDVKKVRITSSSDYGTSSGDSNVSFYKPSSDNMSRRKYNENKYINNAEPDSLTPDQRKNLNAICREAYRVVVDSEVIYEGEVVRKRSSLFLKVPSKTLYPDYRLTIKHPIALNIIGDKINSNCYKSISEFVNDMHLMFSNAQKYNVEGSEVYQDAVAMRTILDDKIKQLCGSDKYAHLLDELN